MESQNKFTVEEPNHKERLDRFISGQFPDQSRSFLQKLIKKGQVCLNDKPCTVPKTPIHEGDVITVDIPEDKTEALIAEAIDLPVLYEDEYLMVINKPAGMVVHPAAGNPSGTVVNALLGRDATFANQDWGDDIAQRPGIVHRLDKDTSGCLVIAKNRQMQYKLSQLFAERKVNKTYAALTYGVPDKIAGEIVTQIGRHPVNRKKMAVVDRHGKEAISNYELQDFADIDHIRVGLMKVKILTGRTHQIRVHLAHLKCPVLGDPVYGGHQKLTAPRQMLHAWRIALPHPVTGETIKCKSLYPDDFREILTNFEYWEGNAHKSEIDEE